MERSDGGSKYRILTDSAKTYGSWSSFPWSIHHSVVSAFLVPPLLRTIPGKYQISLTDALME
jgi:hypothetical protein